MRLSEYRVTNEQARTFARCIYSDIAAYVKEHLTEYQKFLREEQDYARRKQNKATHRQCRVQGKA